MKKREPWERQKWGKKKSPEPKLARLRRVIGFQCRECRVLLPNLTGVRCERHPQAGTDLMLGD